MIGLFYQKQCFGKGSAGFKITTGDYLGGSLFIGDEKGNVNRYVVRLDQQQVIPKSQKEQTKQLFPGKKIDLIRAVAGLNLLLVQADQKLAVIDAYFNKFQQLSSKCVTWAVRDAAEGDNYAIVTFKKKEGTVYVYSPTSRRFQEWKDKVTVSGEPLKVAFAGNFIIACISKKFQFQVVGLDKDAGSKMVPLAGSSSALAAVSRGEVLLASKEVGVFLGTDAKPAPRNPLQLQQQPVIDFVVLKKYIAVVYQNSIQLFSSQGALQDEVAIPGLRSASSSGDRLFVFQREQAVLLAESSLDKRFFAFLEGDRVDDAFKSLKGAQKGVEEALKLDAVWVLIKKPEHWMRILEFIEDINIDARELLALFPQCMLGPTQKLKGCPTMAKIIREAPKKETEQKLQELSRVFLLKVIEKRRQDVMTIKGEVTDNKQKLQFSRSNRSFFKDVFINQPTISEYLQLLDFATVKTSLLLGVKSLEAIKFKLTCKNKWPEFQKDYQRLKAESPTDAPLLLALFQKHEDALRSWKSLAGQMARDQVVQKACQQAVRILKQCKKKQTLEQHLPWMLSKNFQIAMKFFEEGSQIEGNPDSILKLMSKHLDQKLFKRFEERYLEVLVKVRKVQEERYHTMLASLYLQGVFEQCHKGSEPPRLLSPKHERLKQLLRNKDSKYNGIALLKQIQNSWMFEDVIYLYSREGRHKEALEKLVKFSKFQEAQKYCTQNRGRTLTQLYELYIQFYNTQRNQKEKQKKQALIEAFLKRNSTNTELDPVRVLSILPEHWTLTENEGVFNYIANTLSGQTNEGRETAMAKQLSETALLDVEYDLCQAKMANVRITRERKCKVCFKPIQDRVFAVFPNAVVVHQNCIKKEKGLSVCPETGHDFDKYFKL